MECQRPVDCGVVGGETDRLTSCDVPLDATLSVGDDSLDLGRVLGSPSSRLERERARLTSSVICDNHVAAARGMEEDGSDQK